MVMLIEGMLGCGSSVGFFRAVEECMRRERLSFGRAEATCCSRCGREMNWTATIGIQDSIMQTIKVRDESLEGIA